MLTEAKKKSERFSHNVRDGCCVSIKRINTLSAKTTHNKQNNILHKKQGEKKEAQSLFTMMKNQNINYIAHFDRSNAKQKKKNLNQSYAKESVLFACMAH